MGRTPDGLNRRDVVTSFRLDPAEVDRMDQQGKTRGMTRSKYLRWLVTEDGRRIRSEGG